MNSENRIPLAIIIGSLFIAAAIFSGLYISKTPTTESKAKTTAETETPDPLDQYENVLSYEKVTENDHIFGNPDAEITLIEYSDFECPFCKQFHPTAQQIVEKYDGKVNWVYRHFPLNFHDPLATKEAEASECVAELSGNDAFWEYSNKIFETTTSNGNGMEIEKLSDLAVEIGINRSKFDECLESGKYNDAIQQSIVEGGKAGVNGTPGNIVIDNKTGKAYEMTGAQPFSKFKSLIDELI